MVQETGVQSLVESYQRFKKWYLIHTCLTLIIKGMDQGWIRAIQGKVSRHPQHLSVVASSVYGYQLLD